MSLDRSSNQNAESPMVSKGRRRLGWIFGFFLFLAAGLLLLPNILASMLVSEQGLAWLSGSSVGRFSVGHADFSWQSPVLLRDVIVNDKNGHPLAQVDSLTAKRSFWDFLVKPSGPLQLNLDGAKFTVVVHEPAGIGSGESRVREVVERIHSSAAPNAGRDMEVEIKNGTIEFVTPDLQVIEAWTGITAKYLCLVTEEKKQTLQAALPANPALGSGEVTVAAEIGPHPENPDQEVANVKLNADRLSLLAVQSWLREHLSEGQPMRFASGASESVLTRDRKLGWQFTTNSRLVDPAAPEKEIQLALESQFLKQEDKLLLPKLEIHVQDASASLAGSVADLTGRQHLDMSGTIQLPGEGLLEFVPAEIRSEIDVLGMKVSKLTLSGPLKHQPANENLERQAAVTLPPEFSASMMIEWANAKAYGLEVQPGALQLTLQNNRVTTQPLNVSVNGGELRQLPDLVISDQGPVLHFREGVMLANVGLTEEVCRGWIQYISPTLASATSVEGRLTLATNAGQIPLSSLAQGDLAGSMTIQGGKVRPGPLANQVLGQVAQLEMLIKKLKVSEMSDRSIMEVESEPVAFRLYQGRVYHERFGVNVSGVHVETTGSVGVDQTVQMLVSIPFPERWFADAGPVLKALQGEAIQMPVTGTLADPKLDARPVAEFGKRIGIKAVGGLLDRLIERRQNRGR
ncbi:hypothetical protein [Planctomicrobium sp. SH527]|uniref:hypothetical protein n=1 Tax=Planctomicrobium sp. SH527 TaxID=3448123 RepID=UPI003F5B7A55